MLYVDYHNFDDFSNVKSVDDHELHGASGLKWSEYIHVLLE